MTIYSYSPEKNLKLIQERNISFDEIIAAIADNQILDVVEHPNSNKYKNQRIFVVSVKGYVYLVPFVTDIEGNLFLKTIIPSRVAKKRYIEGKPNGKTKKNTKK